MVLPVLLLLANAAVLPLEPCALPRLLACGIAPSPGHSSRVILLLCGNHGLLLLLLLVLLLL